MGVQKLSLISKKSPFLKNKAAYLDLIQLFGFSIFSYALIDPKSTKKVTNNLIFIKKIKKRKIIA
jgi:hypothetical protein